VEHINEDYATIIKEINRRRDKELPELPVEELEVMNAMPGNHRWAGHDLTSETVT
jgi:hypothetical protein